MAFIHYLSVKDKYKVFFLVKDKEKVSWKYKYIFLIQIQCILQLESEVPLQNIMNKIKTLLLHYISCTIATSSPTYEQYYSLSSYL